jgi:predicted kinase
MSPIKKSMKAKKVVKKVVIIRGVQRSGKSSHVQKLIEACDPSNGIYSVEVVSADKFFIKKVPGFTTDGLPVVRDEYVFDPMKIAQAHAQCFNEFWKALENETNLIIVDNTNIQLWMFRNYVRQARYFEYEVEIHEIRVTTIEQLKLCVARNVHRVPMESIVKSAMEFEPLSDATVIPFTA